MAFLTKKEDRRSAKGTGTDGRWWATEDDSTRARKMCDVAGRIYHQLATTRVAMFKYGNLYEELPWQITTPRGYARRRRATLPRLSWNVTKSVCDSYTALVTKDRPKVSVVTQGANLELQRKAKEGDKLIAGIFGACNYYDKLTELAFDTTKFGAGILKIFASKLDPKKPPKIAMDRCLPWDVLVGDQDGMFRQPRSIYHLRFFDRAYLQDTFDEKADDLARATNTRFDAVGSGADGGGPTTDMVSVVEGWHLPAYEGGPGGRFTSAVGDVILEDAPYEHAFFPFLWLYRQLPTLGMYPKSLCQEGAGMQKAIDRLLRDGTRGEAMVAGHWMVRRGTKINTAALNDQQGGIVEYDEEMPVYNAPVPVSPSFYAHLERLVNAYYEIPGISRLAASSQIPAGLESGEAIRTYADVTTDRFRPSYQLSQEFTVEAGRLVLATARDIARDYPDFEVQAFGKGEVSVIKVSDALLDDGTFDIQLKPTNALADEPTSRFQQVNELTAQGTLTPFVGRRLMTGIPDLEYELSLQDSSFNLVNKRLDTILAGGEYEPPDPMMQLVDLPDGSPGAVRLAQLITLKAENDGVDADRIDLLQRWTAQGEGYAQLAQPPTPPPTTPGTGGTPMPPPGAIPGGAPVPAPPQQGQAA